MSTGIVVRVIAPCIASKTRDPAVVVMDEKGRHVISLLSGHIGGANRLAVAISEKLHATPVITTATDLHQVPAIDVIAVDNGLFIENPEAIKTISMAFLNQTPVYLHDPYHRLEHAALDNMIPLTAEINHSGKGGGCHFNNRPCIHLLLLWLTIAGCDFRIPA